MAGTPIRVHGATLAYGDYRCWLRGLMYGIADRPSCDNFGLTISFLLLGSGFLYAFLSGLLVDADLDSE